MLNWGEEFWVQEHSRDELEQGDDGEDNNDGNQFRVKDGIFWLGIVDPRCRSKVQKIEVLVNETHS